jgi:hypothetical protein
MLPSQTDVMKYLRRRSGVHSLHLVPNIQEELKKVRHTGLPKK